MYGQDPILKEKDTRKCKPVTPAEEPERPRAIRPVRDVEGHLVGVVTGVGRSEEGKFAGTVRTDCPNECAPRKLLA